MFSVTYTGIKFRPLCTAIVFPTISGIIVERRDHVRSTFFSLRAFMPSTFVARCASTNGAFFVDRAIISSVEALTLLAAVHDKGIGPLVIARLVTACRLAPWRYRMTSAGGFAFTAAMRMVDRVHRNAAVMRTLSHPARASRLAPGNVFVVRVPNLSNR